MFPLDCSVIVCNSGKNQCHWLQGTLAKIVNSLMDWGKGFNYCDQNELAISILKPVGIYINVH